MVRSFGVLLLSVSCVATALAQAPAASTNAPSATSVARISTGSYTGTVREENGKLSSNMKLTVRDVTPDGRVTARVQASHPRAVCAANLPANGLVLPDGSVRLTVNDGAPEGCERIYNLNFASGNSVSGSFIGGRPAMGAQSAKR